MRKKKLGWALGTGAAMILGLGRRGLRALQRERLEPGHVRLHQKAPGQGGRLRAQARGRRGRGGQGLVRGPEALLPGQDPGPDRLQRASAHRPGRAQRHHPFPGTFSTGQDDKIPGLVVLDSTTNSTLPGFSGPGTNLANLFNLSGVTNRTRTRTELWDTWIVGAPSWGRTSTPP